MEHVRRSQDVISMRFLDVQSIHFLGGFLHVVIRCLCLEGTTREFITFLPFACLPLIIMVNFFFTSKKGLREMNAMTFRVVASVLFALIPHLQSKPKNLVEVIYFLSTIVIFALALISVIFYFAPTSSPKLTIKEKRILNFLRVMLKIVGGATHFSSLVLLISVFMSLKYPVVIGETTKSVISKLCGCLIIVSFSILPWVRIGQQIRVRFLSSLSAYFLAFTLLLLVNKSLIHQLDLAELFPMHNLMNNLVVSIFLHFFEVCILIEYKELLRFSNVHPEEFIKERKTIPSVERKKRKGRRKVIGDAQHGFERSNAPVTIIKEEEEKYLQKTVEYEMPSMVVTTIDTDTLESHRINMFSEIATSSCVSSGGKNMVEEGEKMEISSEADPVPTNIASDIEGRYMSTCTLYCSLFPIDYEFTRDTLVWSWIAAGIINNLQKDEMEKVAIRCFDELIKSKFILPSSYDHLSDQMRYNLGKDGHVSFTNEKYRKKLDSDDNFIDLEHLSLIFQEIDELQLKNLRNCNNLKTLLLHKCYGSKIENILNHLFLELKSVTLIDLSCTNIVELPSSIENLRALMYLNLSQTPIRLLPESIGSLGKLETLILLGCLSLSGLPKSICKLINLQHLELDIARQLQSLPTGMGNLSNLQTLPTFVVGRKDGNGITELRSMNKLKGSLCIFKLENIPNKEEARKARLCDKEYLTKIEYLWSDLEDDTVTIEEGILENLQPHYGLHEVKIVFYSGGVLPSWVSDPSFNQMVNITLSGCRYCERLPTLGELPSLKILSVVDMDSVVCIDLSFCRKRSSQDHQHAFPQLEKLSFDGMSSLESWTGVEDGDFACLRHLEIKSCPKLISLQSLSQLKSLELLKISNCPELPCLPEGSFKCHTVKNCPKLRI